MKNIMPGSLEKFQFILTVKQEEGFSQNELHCPCLKGSPQHLWYKCDHKPCHEPVLGGVQFHLHGSLGQAFTFQVR